MTRSKKIKKTATKCFCPVCDSEMKQICSEVLYCIPCQKKFVTCKCGQVVTQEQVICPSCGQSLR